MKSQSHRHLRLSALFSAAALGLSACGGGGGDAAPAPPPAPVTKTLAGQVTSSGALKNVVVCLDVNNNGACDAGEPASPATGADGQYSLTYDTAKITDAQAAAAPLIAPVQVGSAAATAAVDADSLGAAAPAGSYLLKRPAGSAGSINPLTTLVQTGVAAGMTEAVARQNVALQLGIAAAKIDGYQDDPTPDPKLVRDNARTAAAFTAHGLGAGAVLSVGDQNAASSATPGNLGSLSYAGAGDYYVQTLDRGAKAAGAFAGRPYIDNRVGKTAGAARTHESLYNQAYLNANGWQLCDERPFVSTAGNPSRSLYCGGARPQLSYGLPVVSVAGKAMGTVVTDMQADPYNSINAGMSTVSLLGALGNAAMPAGSELAPSRNLIMTNAPFIWIQSLNTDGIAQATATTLEQLVPAFPASSVAVPSARGTLSLGSTTSLARNLRAAFLPAASGSNAVQFYECDYNAAQNVVSNCAATTTGSYAIETVSGSRVMRFKGMPAQPSMTRTEAYAELDWGGANGKWVYRVRELNTDLTARSGGTLRLNPTGWAAMKAQLGI